MTWDVSGGYRGAEEEQWPGSSDIFHCNFPARTLSKAPVAQGNCLGHDQVLLPRGHFLKQQFENWSLWSLHIHKACGAVKDTWPQAVSCHMQSKNNSKNGRPSRTQSQEVNLTHTLFLFFGPLEKTFHIIYYGITESGNFSEIPPHTSWKTHPQKDHKE